MQQLAHASSDDTYPSCKCVCTPYLVTSIVIGVVTSRFAMESQVSLIFYLYSFFLMPLLVLLLSSLSPPNINASIRSFSDGVLDPAALPHVGLTPSLSQIILGVTVREWVKSHNLSFCCLH